MVQVIDSLSHGVPKPLTELITLGRTLTKRAVDVLAYFDRPGSSNGPTEAICDAWNTSEAPPSGSATSPTTSPDAYSKPADSDPDYTLDSEEPLEPDLSGPGGRPTQTRLHLGDLIRRLPDLGT